MNLQRSAIKSTSRRKEWEEEEEEEEGGEGDGETEGGVEADRGQGKSAGDVLEAAIGVDEEGPRDLRPLRLPGRTPPLLRQRQDLRVLHRRQVSLNPIRFLIFAKTI